MQLRGTRTGLALAAAGLACVVACSSAQATFPGANGDVAFIGLKRGTYGLFVREQGEGLSNRLIRRPDDIAFSPDGRWIAISRFARGQNDIYLVSAADGRSRQVTHTRHRDEFSPAFSPNGKRLVVRLQARRGRSGIATVSLQSDRMRLISPGWSSFDPTWSPTGDWIAFVWRKRLSLMRPDGSDRHRINGGRLGIERVGIASHPDFSPSGDEIAFGHYMRQAVHDVYVTRLDGSGTRRLTRSPAQELEPVFSPDGARVLFGTDGGRRAGSTRLYTVDARDGSGLKRLSGLRGFQVETGASWGVAP